MMAYSEWDFLDLFDIYLLVARYLYFVEVNADPGCGREG